MKNYMRWLIVPAVLAGVAGFLCAQVGEPRKTGKVLLLKTGLAMEGDIEQVGSQYCIHRGTSEVWIAADKAMRLSPDWLDAYAFMQTLIRPNNAGDRVKLARWCHMHRLHEEAMEQAKLALELQPGFAEAKQILTALEMAKKAPPPKTVVRAAAPTPVRNEPPPTVDVTGETLIAFTSKVQPILMNTCVSCHTSDNSKFPLERVFETTHKVSTQRNLAAVLAQVDLDRPAISPLLVKAITPHGREPLPPIRDRSAKPFQGLQEWVVDTVKKNPQLKDYRDAKKPTAAAPTAPEKSVKAEVVSQPAPRIEWTSTPTQAAPEARPMTPVAPPQVREWCDPGHFNDYYHPKR